MTRALALLVAVAVALLPAACGEDGGGDRPTLTVSAAASLKNAFENYAEDFGAAKVRYSFAGSGELAAQIRQGAKPDVFAAASTTLPLQLHRDGLVEKPAVFAGNRLVIAVPSGSSRVRSIDDLERDDVDIVVGSRSAPVGNYTRLVIERLPLTLRQGIMKSIRSEEPDVASVVGKLTQNAADAGFVYITDVIGSQGKLRAIELPRRVQPSVAYAVAVVNDSDAADQAKKFVDGLVNGVARKALREAGFELPQR
jgi:molybdate transport system substrate-binding protein